jgi:hypothetical protein
VTTLAPGQLCGWCTTATALLRGTVVSKTTPGEFLNKCRHGGCDPDLWDLVDDAGQAKAGAQQAMARRPAPRAPVVRRQPRRLPPKPPAEDYEEFW